MVLVCCLGQQLTANQLMFQQKDLSLPGRSLFDPITRRCLNKALLASAGIRTIPVFLRLRLTTANTASQAVVGIMLIFRLESGPFGRGKGSLCINLQRLTNRLILSDRQLGQRYTGPVPWVRSRRLEATVAFECA